MQARSRRSFHIDYLKLLTWKLSGQASIDNKSRQRRGMVTSKDREQGAIQTKVYHNYAMDRRDLSCINKI
jgi:hypothetical protein